jgi:hypothetical protein
MTFRKNSLFFLESELSLIIMAILCLLLIPTLGFVIPLLIALLFVILALAMPKLQCEFITINEAGISCHQAQTQCWAYEWTCVAELRKCTYLRRPALEVIVYDKNGSPNQYALPNQHFQLSKTAKAALKQYHINCN